MQVKNPLRPIESRAILRVRGGGCIGARGALRVIEPPATCEATEAALDFSQKGRAGERGPAGPPGSRLTSEEAAVIDAGAELSTKAPKPGKLKLSRKQLAELTPEKESEAFSAYRDGPVTLGPNKGAKSGVVASLPLPAGRWVIFAKASRVQFRCGAQGGIIRMIKVTVIEVDELTNTPTSF